MTPMMAWTTRAGPSTPPLLLKVWARRHVFQYHCKSGGSTPQRARLGPQEPPRPRRNMGRFGGVGRAHVYRWFTSTRPSSKALMI